MSKSDLENLRTAQDSLQSAIRDPDTVSINSSISKNTNHSKLVFEDDKTIVNDVEPNDGNGGRCKKYFWTQSLAEISISLLVGINLRSKDIDIKYNSKKLFVGLKEGATIIDGDLPFSIKVFFFII